MAKNPFNLTVGSTVWVFGSGDTPQLRTIRSETTRSWIVDGVKIPKSTTDAVIYYHPGVGSGRRYCLTKEAADALFLEYSRWKMAESIRTCHDPAVLRAVAAALGMPTGVDAKEGA